jgi:hypothetical protein
MSGDPVHYALEGITAIVTLDDSKANALSHEVVDARRDGRHLGVGHKSRPQRGRAQLRELFDRDRARRARKADGLHAPRAAVV